MTLPTVTVERIVEVKGRTLPLEHLTPEMSLDRDCSDPDMSSPGLALAGFVTRFPTGRMQVLGETEMTYLAGLSEEVAAERVRTLFGQDFPAAFVTKGLAVPPCVLEAARARGIPVFRTSLSTKDF